MELKPCPFCGGKAMLVSVNERYTVGCTIMRCRGNGLTARDYYTKDEAAEAWNTRSERLCAYMGRAPIGEICGTALEVVSLGCGHMAIDEAGQAPSYCPTCGAKVVE